MRLWTFFRGSAKYTLHVPCPESCLNYLKDRVTISGIERLSEKEIAVTVFYGERDALEEAVKKKGAEIVEKRMLGLPFILLCNRHRWGLAAGLVLALFAVIFSSLFVWEIRVEGAEKVDADEITEVLESVGFYEGVYKKGVDIQSVINRFLIKEDRISWIMINFDGTVAHVELKEAKRPSLIPKKENVNLVAGRNGIIVRADTLEGSCQVANGDAVTEGQLLISAFVDRKDGASSLRGARGYVWAKTERIYSISVPLSYTQKQYSGKVDKGYEITFLGKRMTIGSLLPKKMSLCDMTIEKSRVKLYDKVSLPVHIEKKTLREYTQKTVKRTVKKAKEIASVKALERLKMDSGAFIVTGKENKYEIRDGVLFAEFVFTGVENIARELEFQLY